ncbi:MAG: hypothetical protein E1N59_2828 [Puniceicoccaceae bacterium 5H]|nr:MAG: hypothetical protein E1N59_2828 [Puniceicoccaceae bacterium 5H]
MAWPVDKGQLVYAMLRRLEYQTLFMELEINQAAAASVWGEGGQKRYNQMRNQLQKAAGYHQPEYIEPPAPRETFAERSRRLR